MREGGQDDGVGPAGAWHVLDSETEALRMEGPSDTPGEVERFLIDGYRRMSAGEKLRRVAALNRALEQLAESGIGDAT